jgi:putative effector of murein hydrolase LrgA (UPF0299 family)
MKAPTKTTFVAFAAVLLTLFAAGGLVGRALALPLPAALVGLVLVALGLRVWVMLAALEEPTESAVHPTAPRAERREPLRATG